MRGKSDITQSQNAKTVPKSCKIGLALPNLTLPVNNTVKKEELTRENCSVSVSVEDRYQWKIGIDGRS
jgi:hypothetical protein